VLHSIHQIIAGVNAVGYLSLGVAHALAAFEALESFAGTAGSTASTANLLALATSTERHGHRSLRLRLLRADPGGIKGLSSHLLLGKLWLGDFRHFQIWIR